MEKPPTPGVWFRSQLGLLFLVAALCLVAPAPARAHVGSGASCVNCHSTARSGMSLTGFSTTTNAGAGLLKVFRIAPGETATVGIAVTDGHNEYGLAVVNLDAGGTQDASHHLAYEVGAGWARRSGYYSLGPKTANQSWSLPLRVLPTTPPDVYLLRLRMAGVGGGRWGQEESFYVEVLRPTPPTPSLSQPTYDGHTFAVDVVTAAGFTYHLETRAVADTGSWTKVAEVVGDGTTRTLTDTNAVAAHQVYRVRVE